MEYILKTGGAPQTVNVYVTTKKSQRIRIIAVDANKKNTLYVNHGGTVNGSRKFELPLPQTPAQLKIYVFNEASPKKKKDDSFKVIKFGVTKLKTWEIWESAQTKDFVKFAQMFSENAGVLATSEKPYASDNNQFKIIYVDVIRGKDGKELTTPARISNKTGVIEVAKKYFKDYTVAMRMIILLHEYSHFYLNKVMRNEIQADLNGLYVYLGLGYSPIEAHRAFLTVFSAADTAQNDLRYQMIKRLSQYSGNGPDLLPHRCVTVPTTTTPCLCHQYHVIETTHTPNVTLPIVKVVASGDGVVPAP